MRDRGNRGRACFDVEPAKITGVFTESLVHDLEGGATAERLTNRLVYDPHASFADDAKNLIRQPAGGNLPKDLSVPSDRIDTGTLEPRHTNLTRKRRTLAEASA